VCGRHTKGCPKFIGEGQIRKGQSYKDHLESDPEFREARKEKYFKTFKEKHGVDSIFQLQIFKDKMIEKYGVENVSQSPEIRAKMVENSLEKWGTVHPLANLDHRERLKEIFLERYGVDNPAKSIELREKNQKAYTEKYGVHHPMMRPENKKIQQAIFMARYGVRCSFSVPSIVEKAKKTLIERYGVDNPAFLPGFYTFKRLQLPSGVVVMYQGYEDMMMRRYLKIYKEEDLDISLYKTCRYKFYYHNPIRNRRSYYIPDMYIKPINTMIEVKSVFTLVRGIEDGTLIPKVDSVINEGINIQIEVWDRGNHFFIVDLNKLRLIKEISKIDFNYLENLLS
jgi:hypothetical protein